MKRILTIVTAVLMTACMAAALTACGGGDQPGGGAAASPESALNAVCSYFADNMESFSPEDDSGAWCVFCLKEAESDAVDEDRYTAYYDSLRGFLKAHDGVLSEDRFTSYERTAMAVKAMGEDPTSVEGYDLMAPVDDYDGVCGQGINAEIYALISANYVGYELSNENRYREDILAAQMEDGGISFNGKDSDVDITAMAIQALSFYDDAETQEAVKAARQYLSAQQQDDGSYGNCESTAQVIIALGTLGVDPAGEEDFVKNEATLLDGLMLYRTEDAFCHLAGDETNLMASQQAMLALLAAKKGAAGESVFE